eukprot:scaffold131556_cov30-Phaeocystis_antarctica.AAC.1
MATIREDVVEGVVVELVRGGALPVADELVALLVEEAVVQLGVLEVGERLRAADEELELAPLAPRLGATLPKLRASQRFDSASGPIPGNGNKHVYGFRSVGVSSSVGAVSG